MKYIKFLLLSIVSFVAMACEPDLEDCPEIQRFPVAAFYEGDLIEQIGEVQNTRLVHIEFYQLVTGGYSLAIGDVGTDIQSEPEYILFPKLDGELDAGIISFAAENIVGMINLDEHTFASLNAELTPERAMVTLDFGDDKIWTCDIEAVAIMLE